jgi:hypothetical protein
MKILFGIFIAALFFIFWPVIATFFKIGSFAVPKKKEPEYDPERVNSTGEAAAAIMQAVNRARDEYQQNERSSISEYAMAGAGGFGGGMRAATAITMDRNKGTLNVPFVSRPEVEELDYSALLKKKSIPIVPLNVKATFLNKKGICSFCRILRTLRNGSFLIEIENGAQVRKKPCYVLW